MGTEGMLDKLPTPEGEECEWCGGPAVQAIPVKKSPGTFMYVCGDHVRTAERANE